MSRSLRSLFNGEGGSKASSSDGGKWISVKSYHAIQREKDPNAYD